MKQFPLNGRWMMWAPDSIADWDGLTGDPAAHTGWEYARFQSIQEHHHYGDWFLDVGAEHGILSAVIAREFVGAENMILFEPSAEFWVNIRKIWAYNGLDDPAGCFQGFASDVSTTTAPPTPGWPSCADANEPEIGGMAYRSLANPENANSTPAITIDDYCWSTGLFPVSVNIDVEGAELVVLDGMDRLLTRDVGLKNVWISVHPDLMEQYGNTDDELLTFMMAHGWTFKFLGRDHESHFHFTRKAQP